MHLEPNLLIENKNSQQTYYKLILGIFAYKPQNSYVNTHLTQTLIFIYLIF